MAIIIHGTESSSPLYHQIICINLSASMHPQPQAALKICYLTLTTACVGIATYSCQE